MSKGRILVVEDETIVALDVRSRLARLGYETVGHAVTGGQALDMVGGLRPDLVLMDIMLEGSAMDGIDAASEITNRMKTPVVYLTAYADERTLERAKRTSPLGYLTKPFADHELSLTIELALFKHRAEAGQRASMEALRTAFRQTVRALSSMAEKRDPYTAGHQQRVARLACAIGRGLDLSSESMEGLEVAGILHDIGKIYVPAEILSKPTRLSHMEMGIVKTHPEVGYEILREVAFPWPVARAVMEHHERMDGSGYPGGLKGADICVEARILAVADVVEAMSSHRPYRASLGIDAALEEVAEGRGRRYDPDVVDVCLALMRDGNFQFEERAGNGAPPPETGERRNGLRGMGRATDFEAYSEEASAPGQVPAGEE